MKPSKRTPVLLGLTILLLLLGGGYVLLSDSRPGSDGASVAGGAAESPSDVASDATAGSIDGATDGTPTPSPSEVGPDATVGGANGGGQNSGAGEDGTAGRGDGEDPALEDGDDDPAIAEGDDDAGTAGRSDPGDAADDGDRKLAGDLAADTRNARRSDGLPETGAGAVIPGLVLLAAGLAVRPRR